MARYTGAVCRLCRREGKKLFLKGERCYSEKCSVGIRAYAPGQHGQGRKKSSEYGLQLRAKQTARRFYGVQEGQFRHYFEMAERKQGNNSSGWNPQSDSSSQYSDVRNYIINGRYSDEYKSYYVNREKGLIGLGIYDYNNASPYRYVLIKYNKLNANMARLPTYLKAERRLWADLCSYWV